MDAQAEYVYVIGAVGVQAVKIGRAISPAMRLGNLQIGCPLRLVLMWRYRTDRAVALESALHQRFARQCVRGEWFELGPDAERIVREACEEIAAGLPRTPVAAEAMNVPLSPAQMLLADSYPWISTLPGSVERVTVGEMTAQLRMTGNPLWQWDDHDTVAHILGFTLEGGYHPGSQDRRDGTVEVAPLLSKAVRLREWGFKCPAIAGYLRRQGEADPS